MTRLKLRRGEFKQVQGPVTGQRYTFVRQVGNNPPVDVDDKDAAQMRNWKDGCCGASHPMFEVVE